MSTCLETRGLTKRFPGVVANDSVDLKVQRGEVHSLLGENGSGKTTFMNVVSGLYSADSGEIFVDGRKVVVKSPIDTMRLGIFMVHQNFSLIRPFTVAENVGLLPQLSSGVLTNTDAVKKRIAELSEATGLQVDSEEYVERLPVGIQQRVEILKALAAGARILMLDEPTSVLAPQEVERLFAVLRSMTAKGLTILLTTHNLSEALRYSDRVTILRRGKVIVTEETKALNKEKLIEYMIGYKMAMDLNKPPLKLGGTLLEVKGLKVLGEKRNLAVNDVSFSLRSGEILGIAGVAGNGQKELEHAITGRRIIQSGEVFINGVNVTNRHPSHVLKQGVGVVPEEGYVAGLNGNYTVAENGVLTLYSTRPYSRRLFLNRKEIGSHCSKLISDFEIRPPNPNLKAGSLSGGNMQKLILARELSKDLKVVVASNPTRALDVKMRLLVHQKMLEIRNRGGGVLVFSDDLEEILSLSDTIGVMFRGRIVGTVPAEDASALEVGRLMIGEEMRPAQSDSKGPAGVKSVPDEQRVGPSTIPPSGRA